MSNYEDDDLASYNTTRQRRMRIVAWITIGALVLGGGGATVLALIFS